MVVANPERGRVRPQTTLLKKRMTQAKKIHQLAANN
jgi:hypothetical protein